MNLRPAEARTETIPEYRIVCNRNRISYIHHLAEMIEVVSACSLAAVSIVSYKEQCVIIVTLL